MRALNLTENEFDQLIHTFKRVYDGNADIAVNPKTGDVLHLASYEIIGNLKR
jgi:hypothetical protein